MVNFIIYAKDKTLINDIKIVIHKFFISNNDEYKIYNYDNGKKVKGPKIYILGSNNFNEMIMVAKKIRNSNDYDSPIIFIYDSYKAILNNYLLIFSFIKNDKNRDINLMEAIEKAYDVIINSQTFSFSYNRCIYRVPLNDILYIEKENHSNKSFIHTNSIIYETNISIKEIESMITCVNFMRVHRSCIVNFYNVRKYDYANNILYFDNDKTDIIARDNRNIIKEKLTNKEKQVN